MIVEIKYNLRGSKLLKKVLLREFDDNISEAEVRNEVLWEILGDWVYIHMKLVLISEVIIK